MVRDIMDTADATFWAIHGRTLLGLEGTASDLVADANATIDFELESALRQDTAVVFAKHANILALGIADDGGLSQAAVLRPLRIQALDEWLNCSKAKP